MPIVGVCLALLFYLLPAGCFAAEGIDTTDPGTGISQANQWDPRYLRLREALSDYREIERRGGWPAVPQGALLRLGMRSPQVSLLRQRLVVTNDLKPGTADATLFDEALESAVRHFQKRHGLLVDGIVGPRTRAALNVPVHQRLEQLRINLERRRKLSGDLGSRYIFVNMADFQLKVVNQERTVLTMKVVVGTPYRQTPLFSADLTYVDFNPFWNIPDSIARQEIAPKVREDSQYLARQSIRIFGKGEQQAVEIAADQIDWQAVGGKPLPFRLRQDPGPLNPLGRVKFMFPNPYDVYLHDTPAQHLFDATVRAFSHGCIRVEKPVALAAYLLPQLSEAEVRQIMDDGKRRIIHLEKPIPVHLAYLTAWVNKDGSVNFRDDIYGRDRLVAGASW